MTASRHNDTLATNTSLMITDPYNLSSPNFKPQAGSPVLNAALFTNSYLSNSFFTTETFIGAMGATDWTLNWTNFDPQNTAY
jgi:hypothetical protein